MAFVTAKQEAAMNRNPAQVSMGERGSTLLVSLIMLLLISLLAVSSMQGTILEERMASNTHDRALSFQAAEAALRQGEDLLQGNFNNQNTAQSNNRIDSAWNWDGVTPGPVGTVAGIGGVATPPQYHFARFPNCIRTGNSSGIEVGGGNQCSHYRFEVTARGTGGTANAVTILQSTAIWPIVTP